MVPHEIISINCFDIYKSKVYASISTNNGKFCYKSINIRTIYIKQSVSKINSSVFTKMRMHLIFSYLYQIAHLKNKENGMTMPLFLHRFSWWVAYKRVNEWKVVGKSNYLFPNTYAVNQRQMVIALTMYRTISKWIRWVFRGIRFVFDEI